MTPEDLEQIRQIVAAELRAAPQPAARPASDLPPALAALRTPDRATGAKGFH
jgi:hypothetical protein